MTLYPGSVSVSGDSKHFRKCLQEKVNKKIVLNAIVMYSFDSHLLLLLYVYYVDSSTASEGYQNGIASSF